MKGSTRVFDSWAILAWLLEQPGHEHVRMLLEEAEQESIQILMSWINVGEVYYMAVRKKGPHAAETFLARLPELPIRLMLPSDQDFIEAARLKATRRISYADGFAAALAMKYQAPIVTGDPEMLGFGDVLTVEWIGGPV